LDHVQPRNHAPVKRELDGALPWFDRHADLVQETAVTDVTRHYRIKARLRIPIAVGKRIQARRFYANIGSNSGDGGSASRECWAVSYQKSSKCASDHEKFHLLSFWEEHQTSMLHSYVEK
jgi:hypothetical protein